MKNPGRPRRRRYGSPSRRPSAKRHCAMSLETEIKSGGLERGRLLYFPVVPGRVEFSIALRRLLLERRPALIALELPDFLAGVYRRAVDRLPEISVILYR